MLPSIPDWAFTTAAITLAALAITLFTWNRLRPRTRSKPRCSKCNYDLDGHHLEDTPHFPITCPECGKTFTSAPQLFANPRRWVTPLVVLVLISAYGVTRLASINYDGAWAILPMDVRVLAVRALGAEASPAKLLYSVQPRSPLPAGLQRSNGGRYTPWQARQLLLADMSWLQLPASWLRDVPLRVNIYQQAQWQPEVKAVADDLDRSSRSSGLAFPSYIRYWQDSSRMVRSEADSSGLRTTGLLADLGGAQSHPIEVRVPLADTLSQIKRPIDRASSVSALNLLGIRAFSLDREYFGIIADGVAQGLPTKSVAGLRLDVVEGDAVIATARWFQSPSSPVSADGTVVTFDLPDRMREAPHNERIAAFRTLADWLADPDDRFTVRITTDPEMVLCDFEATHYLDVDITLPGSTLKRKPATATPAAAPAQP